MEERGGCARNRMSINDVENRWVLEALFTTINEYARKLADSTLCTNDLYVLSAVPKQEEACRLLRPSGTVAAHCLLRISARPMRYIAHCSDRARTLDLRSLCLCCDIRLRSCWTLFRHEWFKNRRVCSKHERLACARG